MLLSHCVFFPLGCFPLLLISCLVLFQIWEELLWWVLMASPSLGRGDMANLWPVPRINPSWVSEGSPWWVWRSSEQPLILLPPPCHQPRRPPLCLPPQPFNPKPPPPAGPPPAGPPPPPRATRPPPGVPQLQLELLGGQPPLPPLRNLPPFLLPVPLGLWNNRMKPATLSWVQMGSQSATPRKVTSFVLM